ncbi:MAG: hypothetical protein LBE24_03960 [Methylobacillus sp.]|jgi:hypothetical protein|nr:hypothetical protein [Methylobacillus sp.]
MIPTDHEFGVIMTLVGALGTLTFFLYKRIFTHIDDLRAQLNKLIEAFNIATSDIHEIKGYIRGKTEGTSWKPDDTLSKD